MAADLTKKRINWINTGMNLLFGPQQQPGRPPVPPQQNVNNGGLYAATIALQAWAAEGNLAGFLPTTAVPMPPYPVIDTDFANYPAITAAIFLAAVTALNTLSTDYQAIVAALVALKP